MGRSLCAFLSGGEPCTKTFFPRFKWCFAEELRARARTLRAEKDALSAEDLRELGNTRRQRLLSHTGFEDQRGRVQSVRW